MRARFRAALVVVALAWCTPATAQLALTNLVESRIGSNPFDAGVPKNRNELYDLLDLDYTLN